MRLFGAGVQCKLVKEATGHRSDAVDKYEITSDNQREMMSKIMAGEHVDEVREVQVPVELPKDKEVVNIQCQNNSEIEANAENSKKLCCRSNQYRYLYWESDSKC